MAQAMGVSLKTENEEWSGMTLQIRGGKAGGALCLSSPCKSSVVIPGSPSARLTRGLKPATEVWRLRCSVFRGTPMAFFCVYFKELNCYRFLKGKTILTNDLPDGNAPPQKA